MIVACKFYISFNAQYAKPAGIAVAKTYANLFLSMEPIRVHLDLQYTEWSQDRVHRFQTMERSQVCVRTISYHRASLDGAKIASIQSMTRTFLAGSWTEAKPINMALLAELLPGAERSWRRRREGHGLLGNGAAGEDHMNRRSTMSLPTLQNLLAQDGSTLRQHLLAQQHLLLDFSLCDLLVFSLAGSLTALWWLTCAASSLAAIGNDRARVERLAMVVYL